MAGLEANYLEIDSYEIAHFLLKESGQYDRDEVNPFELLEYLKLEYINFDFKENISSEFFLQRNIPRALLSFPDRIVAVDSSLSDERKKFSALHEIAHYVLPSHQNTMYLCDKNGLSCRTNLTFEKEANELAANLLFKGSLFSIDASQKKITTSSIKELKYKYGASFEAVARRFVEKNLKPVMLIVFKKSDNIPHIDIDTTPKWNVYYCIVSPTFGKKYFASVKGSVPDDISKQFMRYRDIEDSIIVEIPLNYGNQMKSSFKGEFFSNKYNLFCLLTPIVNKNSFQG